MRCFFYVYFPPFITNIAIICRVTLKCYQLYLLKCVWKMQMLMWLTVTRIVADFVVVVVVVVVVGEKIWLWLVIAQDFWWYKDETIHLKFIFLMFNVKYYYNYFLVFFEFCVFHFNFISIDFLKLKFLYVFVWIYSVVVYYILLNIIFINVCIMV